MEFLILFTNKYQFPQYGVIVVDIGFVFSFLSTAWLKIVKLSVCHRSNVLQSALRSANTGL